MYKSKLQELCHQRSWNLPEYTTVKDGPGHNLQFTATVAVNGVPFETQDQCRSSKEAHNQAAKLAFDHFASFKPVPPEQYSRNSPVRNTLFPPYSGLSTSNAGLDVRAANGEILQPIQLDIVQTLQASETSLGFRDDNRAKGLPTSNASLAIRPTDKEILQPTQEEIIQSPQASETLMDFRDDNRVKEMLHLYKNQLQEYAQKGNLTLPVYSCELDGPPHARRFKSRVMFNGNTYETSEYFPTLKEAEHAAAKVAFESLALHEVQKNEGLYKSLLQELAQREGLRFPTYDTAQKGPPHKPTFLSTVEIGGEIFQGQEAKTKKQAEMNAAKAAYNGLAERRTSRKSAVLSPGYHMKRASEVASSIVTDVFQPYMEPNANLIIQEVQGKKGEGIANQNLAVLSPSFLVKDKLVSSSSLQPTSTDDLKQNIKPKAELLNNEEQVAEDKEADINGKRYRCSSSSDSVYARLRDPFPSTGSSHSTRSEYSTNSVVESDVETRAGTSTLLKNKVIVYPRKPNMTSPDDAAVLPFSDEKWLAVKVEINQNL